MNLIKKIMTFVLPVSLLTGCSSVTNVNGKIKEINTFLSSPRVNYLIEEETDYKYNNIVSYYSDEDRIMLSATSRLDGAEIYTLDYSFLYGDGFRVKTHSNNASLFQKNNNYNFNLKSYMKINYSASTTDTLVFDISFNRINHVMYDAGALDTIHSEFKTAGININSVRFHATFKDDKLIKLSMVFDDALKKANARNKVYRIHYNIYGYGSNLSVYSDFDVDSYLLVNASVYLMIADDISAYIETGKGFQFEGPYSYKSYPKYILDDELLGTLSLAGHWEYNLDIYFKDVEYDSKKDKYCFDFYGKTFYFTLSRVDISLAHQVRVIEQINLGNIDKSIIVGDYDNNRILISFDDCVKIFDTNLLSYTKEITVEGDIFNIVVHKDVYHIVTTTSRIQDSSVNYDNFTSNIYVINKASLEIIDTISLPISVYDTKIDKRGDILIACGRMSYQPLFVYKTDTGTLESVGADKIYSRAFIEYDEELDRVVYLPERITSTKLWVFNYVNGSYVYDSSFDMTMPGEYLNFSFSLNGYLVSVDSVISFNDWSNPVVVHESKIRYSLAFYSQNYIFTFSRSYLTSLGNGTIITMLDTSGAVPMKQYYCPLEMDKYIIGFYKDGELYLYNKVAYCIFVFELID